MTRDRPIRIAGASGSASDRRDAFTTFAANHPNDPVDVITGDWMSEANMTSLNMKKSAPAPGEVTYEPTFLEALSPAIGDIAKYGIKVAVNAGASDTEGLSAAVRQMVKSRGLNLKVAWIEGDDVLDIIKQKLKVGSKEGNINAAKRDIREETKNSNLKQGPRRDLKAENSPLDSGKVEGESWDSISEAREDGKFENLCTGETLQDWAFRDNIIGAQAYLGGLGIAKAFQEGADIVVCGRVSDASPVIGAALWWHNWERSQLDEIANAFVAGHLIECSTYVTGGNFSGFKTLPFAESGKGWLDIGYPIAEISRSGRVIITKQKGTGGQLTTETCKAQLLYEIQGPWYFNSDVTAVLNGIEFVQLSKDRVAVKGIEALPPPPTTKVGITAKGGYQAEVHWFLVGLDIKSKARMLEMQIRKALGDVTRFHVLKFTLSGTAQEDPQDQNSATVDFRVFAQARNVDDIAPTMFLRPIIDLIMCSYPGATFHLDFRQGVPKPIQEYYVTLLPQDEVKHTVHMHNGRNYEIAAPKLTKTYPSQQPSQDISASSIESSSFGETVRGPLGWLVHARSGDKGSNANVGFWVRHEEEYHWLRTLLSTKRIKSLLAEEYSGNKIDRFELPNIWAIHFLLHNHLDRGVSCSSTYDFLAKNVAEFLRSRYVDLPKRFLNRGNL